MTLLAACLLAACASGPSIQRQVAVIAPPQDVPAARAESLPVAPAAPAAAEEPAAPTVAAAPPEAPPATAAPASTPTPTPTLPAAPPAPAPAAAEPAAATSTASAPVWTAPPRARVIYFDVDAYKVHDRYRPMLQAHAQHLRSAPNRRLLIRAHADAQGDAEYNLALSRKRAETVKKMLIAYGAPPHLLHEAGVGEGRSAGSGTGAPHWTDRRVELIVE